MGHLAVAGGKGKPRRNKYILNLSLQIGTFLCMSTTLSTTLEEGFSVSPKSLFLMPWPYFWAVLSQLPIGFLFPNDV